MQVMLNYPVNLWLLLWGPLAWAPAPQIPSPLPGAACDPHPRPPGREGCVRPVHREEN